MNRFFTCVLFLICMLYLCQESGESLSEYMGVVNVRFVLKSVHGNSALNEDPLHLRLTAKNKSYQDLSFCSYVRYKYVCVYNVWVELYAYCHVFVILINIQYKAIFPPVYHIYFP